MSPKIRVKAKIGELLVQKGIITQKQLDEALELQRAKHKGKMLGEVLLAQGYATEEEIYGSLATQLGHPYIKISNCIIAPEVLMLVSRKEAESYNLIPIDKIQNILTVAMVNPLEDDALEKLAKNTGCKIKAFVTTSSELKNAIVKNYGSKRP